MILSLYSSVSFKNPLGLAHTMSIASKLGYQAIDVRGNSLDAARLEDKNINAVGYDMISPNSLDDTGITDLKEALKKNKLFISGISCYNSLTLPAGELAEQSISKFREMIDFATGLEIPYVRLIGYSESPFKGIHQDRKDATRLLAKRIKDLCRYGQERQVGILLENGENCIPCKAEESIEIADMVDESNLGIVFDVLNYAFEGLDPMDELRKLRGRVSCLHVKNAKFSNRTDNGYNPKNQQSFKWSLLTEGDIDYKLILDELITQGFDGPIVCEYANPYKGMSRDYWNTMPDPYVWAKDARDYILSFPFSEKAR